MALSNEQIKEVKSTFETIKRQSFSKSKKLVLLKNFAKCYCIDYPNDTVEISSLWGKAKRAIA